VVKVEEAILLPPFLDHKLISILFSPESNPVGATTEDLALVNVCFLATLSNTYLVRRGVRLLVVRPSLLVVPTVPSGDTNMIQSRPLIDDTTSKRRSRRRRHFEDSMMAEELEGSNGVRLRRLIRSYRSQDSFPHKPPITVSVILHVTTFVTRSSSCFMITTYHAIAAQARDISRHHHALCAANAVFFPMHSFSFMFHLFISAYEARQSSPCDFGLDQSDAVPILRFSKKPFHLVRC